MAGQIAALGRRAMTVGGDLSRPGHPGADLRRRSRSSSGRWTILVANAGIGSAPTGILEIALADWERTLAVNLTAPFLLAQRAFAGMLERGFGRIVFLSSVAAYTGGLIGAHYAASKAGLHGLAHSLARQGGAHGVTVNVVAPGAGGHRHDPGRPRPSASSSPPPARSGVWGASEEVADLVAAVVANAYLSNQSIVIDGGTLPT